MCTMYLRILERLLHDDVPEDVAVLVWHEAVEELVVVLIDVTVVMVEVVVVLLLVVVIHCLDMLD